MPVSVGLAFLYRSQRFGRSAGNAQAYTRCHLDGSALDDRRDTCRGLRMLRVRLRMRSLLWCSDLRLHLPLWPILRAAPGLPWWLLWAAHVGLARFSRSGWLARLPVGIAWLRVSSGRLARAWHGMARRTALVGVHPLSEDLAAFVRLGLAAALGDTQAVRNSAQSEQVQANGDQPSGCRRWRSSLHRVDHWLSRARVLRGATGSRSPTWPRPPLRPRHRSQPSKKAHAEIYEHVL